MTAALLVSSLAVFAVGCSGNSGSPGPTTVAGSGSLGPPGGTLTATAGSEDLGTQVYVQPNALQSYFFFSLLPASFPSPAGFAAAGPGVTIYPSGTTFASPAIVTLPVVLPSGSTIKDVVVIQIGPTGTVSILTPQSASDGSPATVTVSVSTLGTFEAIVPAPL
jgi:hypothetical protein